jgi:mono/diheme cytochrome c family protein
MPSLATVGEAPEFMERVVFALLELAAAAAVVAVGFRLPRRRWRWPCLAAAAILAWIAVPSLRLLLVEAHPTSFYQSTTAFSATSIARGKALYPGNCASCHGMQGRGDGPLAASLPEPPADLTAPHLWGHSDGELFWWLTDGIKSPEGEQVMPPFAGVLSEDERWNLIDFIRARNAGIGHAATGRWAPNVQAPKFQAACKDGAVASDDLKGRVVRLAFTSSMPATPETVTDSGRLVTVLAGGAKGPLDETHCVADDPSLVEAYATILGLSPDELSGMQFLIDANGWLRAAQKPGETIDWDDPGALADQVVQLCEHPLTGGGSSPHHHH